MTSKPKAVMSWSGGKDSSMTLHEVLNQGDLEVVSLLTTVSGEYGRISHHGVRERLLDEQAAAIGIPLHKVILPTMDSHACSNSVYEEVMKEAMQRYINHGVEKVVFGDIYLEDLRKYRENNLSKVGMSGVFPLWKRNTTKLVRAWREVGFRAFVCCAEWMLDESFVGVELDDDFVMRLPPNVDPCGENGEFHSFVFDGPIFDTPVPVRVGSKVVRDGRFYADLVTDSVTNLEGMSSANVPPV